MKRRQFQNSLLPPGLVAAVLFIGAATAEAAETGSDAAGFHTVTLSNFYAVRFSELSANDTWQAIPLGRQVFNGIPYQIEGRLDLTGLMAAREGDFAPPRVEGIPVNRRAQRLYLLHGVIYPEKDGVPLAKLMLNYANGETRDLRLAYGLQVRACFDYNTETKAVADSHSRVAWMRQTDSARSEVTLRLYETAFDNPLPAQEITSINLRSMFSRATPFVVALTLQENAPPQPNTSGDTRLARRANEWPDRVYRRQLTVTALDATNATPLTNAEAFLSVTDDQASFHFGSARADTTGRMTLDFSPQHTVGYSVFVKSPGRVPVTVAHSRTNDDGSLPEDITVKLSRGESIGGFVRTRAGEAIPGAELVVSQVTRESSRRYTQFDYDTVSADGAGRWLSSALPAGFSNLQITLTHPLFKSALFVQVPDAPATRFSAPTSAPPTGALACVTPPPGLVAWWPGDGHTGSLVSTNSGIRRVGMAYAAGKADRAFIFNGLNAALRIPAAANLDVGRGPGLTIEAWIQPRNLAERGPLVEWNSGKGPRPWGLHLYILAPHEFTLGAGNLYANLQDTNGVAHELKAPGGTVTTNEFQHVALTYDKASGVGRLFRNGQVVAEQNLGTFTPQTGYEIFLGRRPYGDVTAAYAGIIDELALYQRALSQAEIQAIVKADALGKCKTGLRTPTAGTSVAVATPPKFVATSNLLTQQAVLVMDPATRIAGVVRDEQGQAVPKADVYFFAAPERRDPAGRWQTDHAGQFAFSTASSGMGAVAVLAKGFAPKYVITPNTESNLLSVILRKGVRVTGRVREAGNEPVANATVRLDGWHNTTLVRWQTRTDAEGRFVWDDAPEDQVMLYITASNYYSTRYSLLLEPGRETLINLSRPLMAFGKVVDAETKKAVTEFTVVQGYRYQYSSYEPIRWQRYNLHRGRGGEYSMRLNNYGSATNWLLVEAKGYLPIISPPFSRGGWVTNHFELKKGKGLEGLVQGTNGEPVINCMVVLAETGDSPSMSREAQLRAGGSSGDAVRTDRQGRFEFAPKLEARRLFAAHDQGYVEMTAEEFKQTGKLVLAPWGRVQGVSRVGTNWAGQTILLQTEYDRSGAYRSAELSLHLPTQTDTNGQFTFARVPAGWRRAWLQYPKVRTPEDDGSIPLSHGTPVLVTPGETATVTLGGTGRSVVGRMAVVGAKPSEVNWLRDVHTLNLRLPPPTNVQPPMITGNLSPEEQRKLFADYEQRQRDFWSSAPGRTLSRQSRTYALLFDTNGHFRIENVEPGSYDLTIYLNEREPYEGGGYSIRQIGYLHKPVEIPAPPSDQPAAPYDLDALEITVRRPLQIGQPAPPLQVPALSGQTVNLDTYRGTNVLLYFGGLWTGQQQTDVQVLKTLQQTYGDNGRLAIILLSVDNTRQEAEAYAKTNGLPWVQCYLGQWSQTQVPARFGIEGVPHAILIDAEGRVLAKNLRGPMMNSAVRSRLAGPMDLP